MSPNDKYYITILQGHEQAVNEVQFHAQQPHHMFSCSESGEVWHWDGSAVSRSNFGNQGRSILMHGKLKRFMEPLIVNTVQLYLRILIIPFPQSVTSNMILWGNLWSQHQCH